MITDQASQWIASLRGLGWKGALVEHVSLARHTYYQLGGPAQLLGTPEGVEDLEVFRTWRQTPVASNVPLWILGKGSNVLISDSGLPGVTLKLSRLGDRIDEVSNNEVSVGASRTISSLLSIAAQQGWSGFERLCGIPGSVGGAIRMNAGTHLGEIADLVKFIEVINLSEPHTPPIRISKRELDFSYRTSGLLEKHPFWVILNAGLVFERRPPEEVSQRIQETLERRKSTQPLHAPSCGSVFRNPAPTIRAWQVIENLGLRGSKIGGAQVSEKHSNFIINCGNARASDVYALIRKIQSEAQRRLGIHLEPEVQVMGDFILQDRIES